MTKTSKPVAKPKRHRKAVILFVVLAFVLVAPTIVLSRASSSTDERVTRWFLQGVDIHKVAAESKKERQYALAALGVGTVGFLALCAAIIFEAKHIKQTRDAKQTVETTSSSIAADD